MAGSPGEEHRVTWEQLNVMPALRDKLAGEGIEYPTSVQAEAVPAMLAGRDVSARSQTGSGKTLAFLLPVLQRIDASGTDVQAVVIAPTQELAMQIVRVAETYGEPLGIRVLPLQGGAALKRQVERLKTKPQLVVGTPGRIHELLHMRKLKLHAAGIVVVDEADQVFDLGSTREIEAVLKATPRDRMIAFFSATHPQAMAELEIRWMRDPVRIDIAPEHRVAASISHFYVVSDRRDKTETARKLIRLLNPASALLFLNNTDNVANWEAKLGYEGFTVETLYGDADKMRRARTLARFRDGRCQLLLATDVAARGIDIEGLPLVVNLEPPVDADHYVHRAGRTGRMGREGTVVSIVTPQELFIMEKFRKQLGIELPQKVMSRGRLVTPDELRRRPEGAGSGKGKWRGAADEPLRSGGVEADGAANEAGTRGRGPAGMRRAGADSKPQAGRQGRGAGGPLAVTGMPGGGAAAGARAGVRGGEADGAGKPRGAASAGQPAAAKPSAKSRAERERLRKDKGAPKWLKAKRDGSAGGAGSPDGKGQR